MNPPKIAVAPDSWRRPALEAAVVAGGGELSGIAEAQGLIWIEPTSPEELQSCLDAGPALEWVQLPFAGIEPYLGVLSDRYHWTCGKGIYAKPVAEHALMLLLAGMRGLGTYARAEQWLGPEGKNLLGAKVAILGGGGITQELLKLLAPWDVDVTVIRKHPGGQDSGAAADDQNPQLPAKLREEPQEALLDCLSQADAVVLALALTPETRGIINAEALRAMPDDAWLVNVARGEHIVTDDLTAALTAETIGGAGLDVTHPEPLPDGHPLWSLPNCLITPHVGNTPEMGLVLLAERVTENVARFAAGRELLGPVYLELNY